MRALAVVVIVFSGCLACCPLLGQFKAADEGPMQIFEQRIMPIFRSEDPSSCVQCHLSSVDLKEYILPSHEQTFLSMRAQGLIDVKNPSGSKILELIEMGQKDLDKGARMIHEKNRKAEYEALAAWIEACCNDQALLSKSESIRLAKSAIAQPAHGLEVIRHARKSRVVDSFARNVFSQRMRCFPCHTPHEIDPNNPKHKNAQKKHGDFEEKYGAKMNIFGKTPEATMRNLVNSSRRTRTGVYPMLNLKDPAKSLLVLKPTAKLPKRTGKEFVKPSSGDPVSHMGGLKMHRDDQSYKSFIAWIQDYANVVEGNYTNVEELPADNWQPTKLILKVADVPDDWETGTPVQLFLHRWNEKESSWSDAIGFTQGTVTPRHRVNGALFLFKRIDAAEDASNGVSMSPEDGKYLVKLYVDAAGKLAADPALMLGEQDFAQQVEIQIEDWRPGFPNGTLVSLAPADK